MINSFSTFLTEQKSELVFTWGRMNPMTIGHEKLLNKVASVAGSNHYRIYLTQSQDSKKNPLAYTDKVKWARKAFPKHARNIMLNTSIKSIMDVMVDIFKSGYKNVTMVVGDDRVHEFDILLNKYNGMDGRHGLYKFDKIKIVSAGERDPDADDVSGMSASKLRGFVQEGDYIKFSQGVPQALNNAETKRLFNDIRRGMGLSEETHFTKHIQLEPISETREKYVSGELFEPGDSVVIKESDEVGTIKILGTNYVIVETADRKRIRKWLDDVELLVMEKKEKGEDDSGILDPQHVLNPKLPLKHAVHHAVSHDIDRDNDGDVDELDLLEPAVPDETGVADVKKTLKFIDKYKKEKQHTRRGVAFQ